MTQQYYYLNCLDFIRQFFALIENEQNNYYIFIYWNFWMKYAWNISLLQFLGMDPITFYGRWKKSDFRVRPINGNAYECDDSVLALDSDEERDTENLHCNIIIPESDTDMNTMMEPLQNPRYWKKKKTMGMRQLACARSRCHILIIHASSYVVSGTDSFVR
jgi:hypothetical protein